MNQTSKHISVNEEITKFNTDLTEESQQLNQSSKVPKLPAMSGVVSPFNLQVERLGILAQHRKALIIERVQPGRDVVRHTDKFVIQSSRHLVVLSLVPVFSCLDL